MKGKNSNSVTFTISIRTKKLPWTKIFLSFYLLVQKIYDRIVACVTSLILPTIYNFG